MIFLSYGMRRSMLAGPGVAPSLVGGSLILFSGPVPATADTVTVAGNVALLTITGASMDGTDIVDGLMHKVAGVWSATSVAGTPSFFRHCASGDVGTDAGDDTATLRYRVQGEVGLGKDMQLGVTSFAGGVETINYHNFIIPAAALLAVVN